MSFLEHNRRATIFGPHQHPFQHDVSDFPYTNDALIGNDVGAALDWLFAVLYPNQQPSVPTVGDLPTVGNNLNDMRIVEDDGDGKAASYRWEQREGDVAPQWYKIYDMDWGFQSVLSGVLNATQDVYAYKYGYDDTDTNGDPITGDLAGQRIYGGASANTHLTLYANAGDGTGPNTGYIQHGDNVRPLTDNSWTLGTATYRYSDFHTVLATIAALGFSTDQITSTTGQVNFTDENITTTGSVTAGTLSMGSGSILDTSGAINFGDENLLTTGTVGGGVATFTSVQATGAASNFANNTVIGTIQISSNTIQNNAGDTISLAGDDLFTTGNIRGDEYVRSSEFRAVGPETLTITYLEMSTTNPAGFTFAGTLTTYPYTFENPLFTQDITTTGDVGITGVLTVTGNIAVDNMDLNLNTFSSTTGDITIDPFTGLLISDATIYPTGTRDLGRTTNLWQDLYISGGVSDGTNTVPVSVLLSLRDILDAPAVNHAIFWNSATSRFYTNIPDLEVDHGTIFGLGDDDHAQYALLAGRSGGQTLYGSQTTAEHLTLQGNSVDAATGDIIVNSIVRPPADNTIDLGANTTRFKDLYLRGFVYHLKLENVDTGSVGAAPATEGRLVYNTPDSKLYVDTGGVWSEVGGGASAVVYTSLNNTNDGYTAGTGESILADTTTAAFTVNLPATPSVGDYVVIYDAQGTFDTNNLTIGRNGSNIEGAVADFLCVVKSAKLEFIYVGGAAGWKYYG